MILLLVASAAMIIAAVLVAATFIRGGTIALLLGVALLADVLVVASIAIAGIALRSLTGPTLTALSVAWLLAAGLLVLRRPRAPAIWRRRLRRGVRAGVEAVSDPAVAIAAILVLALLAWRLVLAVRLPIVDYDGWSYHLVFTDVWVERGALTLVPQRIWTAGYPAIGEILATWFAVFTRSDALTGLASLLSIPAAIVATAGLARRLGASRAGAALAGLLLGLTPALLALAGTTYVDNASVAFVVASWWFGLRVVEGEERRTTALLLGIATGLAIGTKGTNVILVLPVAAVAGLVLIRRAWSRGEHPPGAARGALERALLLAAPIVLFGVSWYLKNLLVHGNPLYPFAVGPFAGPTTLTDFTFTPAQLAGRSPIEQLLASWTYDWRLDRYAYNQRPGGLGRAWPIVAAAALVGIATLVRRQRLAALGLVVVPALVAIAIMPMPWYARLTLFLPALALPLAALGIDRLPRRPASLAGLALVLVAGVSAGYANIHPNIDIRPAVARSPSRVTAAQYLGYVFRVSDARRADVSLRHECAGFDAVPSGSVVVPAGFNLLHGVVGPNLDRTLGEPVADVVDGRSLVEAVQSQGASWFVTSSGSGTDAIAESSPDLFVRLGDVCQGARLWRLASTGS